MSLIFNRLIKVVNVQGSSKMLSSAAVHELSCSQGKTQLKTILPSLPRAVSNELRSKIKYKTFMIGYQGQHHSNAIRES